VKQIKFKQLPESATNLERILAAIPEGRSIVLSYLRQMALTDETYKKLIQAYDADKKLDLGALCNELKIPHATLLADVMKEAYPIIEEALNLSKMISTGIVAARLPKVVERSLIEGAKREGITDRHFTLQNEGFHTAPKGMSINVNQNQINAGLPNFEDETKSLADILRSEVDGAVIETALLTEGDDDEFVEIEEEKEIIAA
jgi:hypothetical protein